MVQKALKFHSRDSWWTPKKEINRINSNSSAAAELCKSICVCGMRCTFPKEKAAHRTQPEVFREEWNVGRLLGCPHPPNGSKSDSNAGSEVQKSRDLTGSRALSQRCFGFSVMYSVPAPTLFKTKSSREPPLCIQPDVKLQWKLFRRQIGPLMLHVIRSSGGLCECSAAWKTI